MNAQRLRIDERIGVPGVRGCALGFNARSGFAHWWGLGTASPFASGQLRIVGRRSEFVGAQREVAADLAGLLRRGAARGRAEARRRHCRQGLRCRSRSRAYQGSRCHSCRSCCPSPCSCRDRPVSTDGLCRRSPLGRVDRANKIALWLCMTRMTSSALVVSPPQKTGTAQLNLPRTDGHLC